MLFAHEPADVAVSTISSGAGPFCGGVPFTDQVADAGVPLAMRTA